MMEQLDSFPVGGSALVLGASGGIGRAVAEGLVASGRFARVIGASRSGAPRIDLEEEDSMQALATEISASSFPLHLVFDATGFLHDERFRPERSWSHLDVAHMEKSFRLNAMGPALLMKHLLPLFPRRGKAVFATLSARVGSIGDNRYGGWYAYRASKAALNQLVKTASIELSRKCPEAICVALHPGTVETSLTAPYSKQGLDVRSPQEAASQLIGLLDGLTSAQSGAFLDYRGEVLPW